MRRVEPDQSVPRREHAREALDRLVAWLLAEAESRVRQRSYGRQSLTLTWEDGFLRLVEVEQRNVFKPGQDGRLPEVDSP